MFYSLTIHQSFLIYFCSKTPEYLFRANLHSHLTHRTIKNLTSNFVDRSAMLLSSGMYFAPPCHIGGLEMLKIFIDTMKTRLLRTILFEFYNPKQHSAGFHIAIISTQPKSLYLREHDHRQSNSFSFSRFWYPTYVVFTVQHCIWTATC